MRNRTLLVMFFGFGLLSTQVAFSQDIPVTSEDASQIGKIEQDRIENVGAMVANLTINERQTESLEIQSAVFQKKGELSKIEKSIVEQALEIDLLKSKFGARHPDVLAAQAKANETAIAHDLLEKQLSDLNIKLQFLVSPTVVFVKLKLAEAGQELESARRTLGEKHPTVQRLVAIQDELKQLVRRAEAEELKMMDREYMKVKVSALARAIQSLEMAMADLSPKRCPLLESHLGLYESLARDAERLSKSANTFWNQVDSDLRAQDAIPAGQNQEPYRLVAEKYGKELLLQSKETLKLQQQKELIDRAAQSRSLLQNGPVQALTLKMGNADSSRIEKIENRLDNMESLLKEIAASLSKSGGDEKEKD